MKAHFSRSEPPQERKLITAFSRLPPIPRRVEFVSCGLLIVGALLAAAFAWSVADPAVGGQTGVRGAASPSDNWIRGTEEEKFELVSKHLRGLDMTMVEMGYRYAELYWAGQDRNWEFAAYQLDKIRLTIELGLERRPKRAASAQSFLTNSLPLMKQAIEKKDSNAFEAQFKLLTVACNICHTMEKMPFVQVQAPEHRLSPVRINAP